MTTNGPGATTIPASDGEGNVGEMIAELQLALANVGELIDKLSLTLTRVKLAQLTGEHRINVQRANHVAERRWLVDLERRMRAVEHRDTEPTAAE